MNLIEHKNEILRIIDAVHEAGDDPNDVEVSIQIERGLQPPLYSHDIEILYDNYGDVSGCVIYG